MTRSAASGLMAVAFSATVLFIVVAGPVTDWVLKPPPSMPLLTADTGNSPAVEEGAASQPAPSAF